jgi:predicted Rossmann-fold nucleotide-binding protein
LYYLPTGTGQARNLAVICSGDTVVGVGGEYGTLSEIGLALKIRRPVVALESWNLGGHVVVAALPEESVEKALCAVHVSD